MLSDLWAPLRNSRQAMMLTARPATATAVIGPVRISGGESMRLTAS